MKIRGGDRRTGKTTEIVAWFRNNPSSVLVVTDDRERARIARTYGLTDEEKARIVTADILQIRSRIRGMYPRPRIGVDNLDLILSGMFGGEVGMVTYTEEEE